MSLLFWIVMQRKNYQQTLSKNPEERRSNNITGPWDSVFSRLCCTMKGEVPNTWKYPDTVQEDNSKNSQIKRGKKSGPVKHNYSFAGPYCILRDTFKILS
jgi:hypothetical protein